MSRWFEWPALAVDRRLLLEYGAPIAAAESIVVRPLRVRVTDSAATRAQQDSLGLRQDTVAGVTVRLQAPVLEALRRAVREAQQRKKHISPRGGPTAAVRTFEDTDQFWKRYVEGGLRAHVQAARMSPAFADSIRRLPRQSQIDAVLRLEAAGLLFGLNQRKPILNSVSAPGASQHLFGYAFDVLEHDDSLVRFVLNHNGFWQTVADDLPHFTFLGPKSASALCGLGLVRLVRGDRVFWVPAGQMPEVVALHPLAVAAADTTHRAPVPAAVPRAAGARRPTPPPAPRRSRRQ